MKRWFAILFLSFFALDFAGIYFYFALRLVHIKQEMRAALKTMPEENLTRLVLTEDEFRKSRVEDHEIKVDGKMYDIARITVDKGQVTVLCLHDKAEDSLFAFLDAVSNRAHNDTSPLPKCIHQFLTLTYLIPEFSFSFLPVTGCSSETIYRLPVYSYKLSVQNPPPRL